MPPTRSAASSAREELVAELGATFLCAETGMVSKTAKNSAAYLQHWLKALKSDRRFLLAAASKAQKAADWVRGERKSANAGASPETHDRQCAASSPPTGLSTSARNAPGRDGAFLPRSERNGHGTIARHQQYLVAAHKENRFLLEPPSKHDRGLDGEPGREPRFAMHEVGRTTVHAAEHQAARFELAS